MVRTLCAFALGAGLAAATALAPGDALACSVCLAGDPVFSNQGASAQQEGDFSVYLELRGWKKRSGVLPGEDGAEGGEEEAHDAEERNDSQRLDLFLSWTPIDRITLTLDIPWAFNGITEIEAGGRVRSTLSGLGDVSLTSSVVLWRNRDVLPSTWVEGRAFVKLPTGESRERVDGRRDPHLQVGTGSWDVGLGLGAVHRLEWGSLYGSVFYRENTEGSLDYEYGDVVLANLALEVPIGHALKRPRWNDITAGLELNYRYSERDVFRGMRFDDSGGSILYVTPSLRYRLPFFPEGRRPSLRTAVQIPLSDAGLHGFQEEEPIWFVGLQYTF